jgi:hypothetical protein
MKMELIGRNAVNDSVYDATERIIVAVEEESPEIADIIENARDAILKKVSELQNVDAEPVKHGRWIPVSEPDDNGNVISCCSICSHSDDQCTSIHVPYCWFCGAKMDVETE